MQIFQPLELWSDGMMKILLAISVIGLFYSEGASAAGDSAKTQSVPVAPAVLPGRGLAEHDFFYAGESKDRKMYIVRKGQVVWSYDDPAGKGEISDAMLLPNGNVLFAHQFAVKLIAQDKKLLWNFDAPVGFEIHTAQMIGKQHVLFIQNGDPATLKVVNIITGETRREFPLSVKNPKAVHGQFRHARLTAAGTILVAHMDNDKVCEYNADGKEIWSIPASHPWGVTPLKNGNLLITEREGSREITRERKTVWQFAKTDAPDYVMNAPQQAWRLPDGNTVVNNWFNLWGGKVDPANAPVQAVELTPDKKIVWALREWGNPDLGPATTIQILDDPIAPEPSVFGDIK